METRNLPGLDAALADLQPDMVEAAMWVVPENERHFEPISFVSGLGLVLLTAFLAGFQEEASRHARAFGGDAATWLAGKLKSIATIAEPSPQIEAAAREGASLLRSPDPDPAALDASEAAIAAALAEHLPPDQARGMAARLRQAAVAHMGAAPA